MKKILIERKRDLAPVDFVRDHLRGPGKPVIVTDATATWPARAKWTFEFFKNTYGSDFASAPLGLFGDVAKITKLATYIDHLDTPAKLPGFWVNTSDLRPLRTEPENRKSPPYLLGWYAFQQHPELYEDIKPAPYFVSDWTLALDRPTRDLFQMTCGRDYWALYLGPENSRSQLHQDFWHTHSYLAQIRGRKRVILFSPEDSAFLYGGAVDPEEPDLDRFEMVSQATAYEGMIGPGDVLFTPADWWHCVRGLEKSITVSHNFFNDVNFSAHLTRLVRKLPKLVATIECSPILRDAMKIEWRSCGFDDSDR